MQIFIDVEPHEDKRVKIDIKCSELARAFTGFCALCRCPTSHLFIWEPTGEQHKLAAKVPPGKARIFFFPICNSCSARGDMAEAEIQWRTIESLNVNIPLGEGHSRIH